MMALLIVLFTLLPALEFYLLFKIGSKYGALNTFSIIILTGVVGAILAKSQGLIIFYRIQRELQKGGLPGKQLLHGFLVFGGGLLLLTPGFITDILGFSMVIPGTRHILVQLALRFIQTGLAKGTIKAMNIQTFSSKNTEDPNIFEAEYKKRN